jgi:hypothetical protein
MDRRRFHQGLCLALFAITTLPTQVWAEPREESRQDSLDQTSAACQQGGCYAADRQDSRATLVAYQAPVGQAPPLPQPVLEDVPPGPPQPPAADDPMQAPDGFEPSAIPDSSLLSSSIGDVGASQYSAPFMIGDAFGPGIQPFGSGAGHVGCPVATTGVVGQSNLAENFSPMPRDRVYMNYSFFGDVPLNPSSAHGGPGVNVNRWTPGAEKTFFNQRTSVEIRLPFAGTLSNTINDTGTNNTSSTQFGNVFLAFKGLLYRTNCLAFSGGMSMTLPTANDITIINPAAGINQLVVNNNEVHLQPFLSFLHTPNDRFYWQGLCQVDMAVNSDTCTTQSAGFAPTTGTYRDQTYIYSSISAGYWLYRNPCSRISGFSPIFEAHYSKSVSYNNALALGPAGNTVLLGVPGSNFGLLNMTVGGNVQLGPLSSLLMAYVVPVGSGSCKQFDGELRVLFNRRFGPQSRYTRAQF